MTATDFWFWAFMLWSFPMGIYRSRFRKMVYETEDWTINIKPYFTKEMKGLLGNLFPDNPDYIKLRNFYRFYLAVYLSLFLLWRFSH